MYLIDPVDTFFFRSPAPFEAGGVTIASDCIFPPLPSTLAGALKVFRNGESIRKYKIKFNGLWIDETLATIVPNDLFIKELDEKLIFEPFELKRNRLSSSPLDYILVKTTDTKYKKMKQDILAYLPMDVLKNYLNMNRKEFNAINIKEGYYFNEPRIGNKIDLNSRATKDQMLYEIPSLRFDSNKLKLAVEAEGIEESINDSLKIGGENKRGFIQSCFINIDADIEANIENKKHFKLYFATPAILKNGWLPYWIDENTMIGSFKRKKTKIKVKLICASVGRKIPCGGYGGNKVKKMLYAIPAGSVYYFEILEGRFQDAIKLFHKQCLSDYREGLGTNDDSFRYEKIYDRSIYCNQGFGYTFVGVLTNKQEEQLNE